MFFYKRKTSFIAYYINGIKSRSIGVVKQCLTEGGLDLSVDLFGLDDRKDMRCQVSVGNAKERQQVFEMEVYDGCGKGEYSLSIEILRKTGASKIFFSLGNDCYGIADLCEVPANISNKYTNDIMDKKKEIDVGCEAVKTENFIEEVSYKENNPTDKTIAEIDVQDTMEDAFMKNDEEAELLDDCLAPQPDKWEVIKKKYPILYPFRGQGPYVSIKPVDLQLLDSKYHHLSNNSFLMHNFYQYKHLILGEYAWEKGTFFYVGVPGEFVKKEQNTAAMFGFEGYEHSGDLGYYLYRVAL